MGVLSRRFLERLASGKPLLLDAAMGTELQRRDANTALPLWSARTLLKDPEVVWTIHGDEAAAGAEILTANTFRTHARTLAKADLASRSGELTALAVQLAHQAASVPGREIFVAGSLAPLEDCYRPDLVPDQTSVEREHGAQARFLAEAGVDLILAETHNTIREAAAALAAGKAAGVPVVVSLVTDGEGKLLSGERLEDAVEVLLPLSPDALGINCVTGARLAEDLERLAAAAPGRPLAAYGNLGLPSDDKGWSFTEELEPEKYAEQAARWIAAGARIVGGCCGTTPEHTRALRRFLDDPPQERSSPSASSSSIASPKE